MPLYSMAVLFTMKVANSLMVFSVKMSAIFTDIPNSFCILETIWIALRE